MVAMIMDQTLERNLIARRRASGEDRYDEVWEGIYVMSPQPNNEHQDFVNDLDAILTIAVKWAGLGRVQPGANISDRDEDWEQNFRCPDLLVFLHANAAIDRESHWVGGSDLAIEIVSPHDRSYEKLDFYATVNTREVLIVDRDPWQLVLYRLSGRELLEVSRSTLDASRTVKSEVVPLSFQLIAGGGGPQIEVTHHDGQQRWIVTSTS